MLYTLVLIIMASQFLTNQEVLVIYKQGKSCKDKGLEVLLAHGKTVCVHPIYLVLNIADPLFQWEKSHAPPTTHPCAYLPFIVGKSG